MIWASLTSFDNKASLASDSFCLLVLKFSLKPSPTISLIVHSKSTLSTRLHLSKVLWLMRDKNMDTAAALSFNEET